MSGGHVPDNDPLPFDYAEYLEAKAPLDNRCRNPRVWSSFLRCARGMESPRLLDLGTGTGMLLRRLIGTDSGFSELWGVEKNGRLCLHAFDAVSARLADAGYRVRERSRSGSGGRITGEREGCPVTVVIRQGDALVPASLPEEAGRFHCITANAFLDLVPLDIAVDRLRSLLREGGLVYAAVNYDGITALFPECEDQEFEEALIGEYNRSMDAKTPDRVPAGDPGGVTAGDPGGVTAGGSRTGTLFLRSLLRGGFTLLAAGPSDWTIFPAGNGYQKGEEFFLNCLLSMMYREGRLSFLAGSSLDRWLACRRRHLDEGKLGLLTHQVDVLGRLGEA